MRRCPACRRAPRAHDPMHHTQTLQGDVTYVGLGWPAGGYEVCWDCWKALHPEAPPLPPPRRNDSGDIFGPQDQWDRYLCAVCGDYAREDDPLAEQGTCIRLTADDVLAGAGLTIPAGDGASLLAAHRARRCPDRPVSLYLRRLAGVAPGVKRCCRDCWFRWAPVVKARWERDRVIPAGLPLEALGHMLV